MTTSTPRRQFLRTVAGAAGTTAALCSFPPAIQKALAIPAARRTGTLADVQHIVILMQENRSFDHYYGTLGGVRGFADPFPIPRPDAPGIAGSSVWTQPNLLPSGAPVLPFRIDTEADFRLIRINGTPHSWSDAQLAWNHGRLDAWPRFKQNHAMAYYAAPDLPFQWALANAFTLCDHYHCSSQTGTNTNRLFQWTGTNDGLGQGNGPATYNDYDNFDADPGANGGYTWTTYPERLQAAGISWQVYENMADNFTDNPLAGFQSFRAAWFQTPGYSEALRQRGVSTRDLDLLREDVLANQLPQVSWVVATAEGSEHPGPSSPAQGADYTSRVLEALTANPEVWAKTVLILNFDENDGFFDHLPPPAPPSVRRWSDDPARRVLAGASTADTRGEYHEIVVPYHDSAIERALLHRPYGLGPRVPMTLISPWSKGGWVCSQVFDHTSVLRFVERRFGVPIPEISAWRRAVCGDLTSTFNFADPDDSAFFAQLPETLARANAARALPDKVTPRPPASRSAPVQADGVRPARALPYALEVRAATQRAAGSDAGRVRLALSNAGEQAAVLHVYDRLRLADLPQRYTVEPGRTLAGVWPTLPDGRYDLWVLGPNGFHRHATGNVAAERGASGPQPEVLVTADRTAGTLTLEFVNQGAAACRFTLRALRFDPALNLVVDVPPRSRVAHRLPLHATNHWYDLLATVAALPGFARRLSGHLETGAPSTSDPTMYGPARLLQDSLT
jgi:phospholipase C